MNYNYQRLLGVSSLLIVIGIMLHIWFNPQNKPEQQTLEINIVSYNLSLDVYRDNQPRTWATFTIWSEEQGYTYISDSQYRGTEKQLHQLLDFCAYHEMIVYAKPVLATRLFSPRLLYEDGRWITKTNMPNNYDRYSALVLGINWAFEMMEASYNE